MFLCTGETVVNANGYEGEIHALRCKRWSCPHCKHINRQRVIQLAKCGLPTAMMTLTVDHGRYDSAERAARDLIRGLVLLRRRIKRRFGVDKLPFLAVFEKHKSGWPHLHILIRAPFLPVKVLRGMWTDITGAWNVNIIGIGNKGQALYYAAKYIGKDLEKFEGCKRWWRSHNFNVLDDAPPEAIIYGSGYIRFNGDPRDFRSVLRYIGAEIEEERSDKFYYRMREGPPMRPGDLAQLAKSWFRAKHS